MESQNGQQPAPPQHVQPQPMGVSWQLDKVGTAQMHDGGEQPLWLVQIHTVHGPHAYFFNEGDLRHLADKIHEMTSGIQVVRDLPPDGHI